MSFKLSYKAFGKHAILVEWPNTVDEKILNDVLLFKKLILETNNKLILYINNAYNSLLINYDLSINNIYDEILALKTIYTSQNGLIKHTFRHWKIPVCYDAKFGIDLDDISCKNNLTITDIINLHSQTIYTIYFIGFLPGFLYLGGLDKRLHFSRKSSPRLQVKKGAVGIGEMQTGIYPNQSPGGWNIIGNSPINFFDVSKAKPCFASSGDKIQFVPISIEAYQSIKDKADTGLYQIENSLVHD